MFGQAGDVEGLQEADDVKAERQRAEVAWKDVVMCRDSYVAVQDTDLTFGDTALDVHNQDLNETRHIPGASEQAEATKASMLRSLLSALSCSWALGGLKSWWGGGGKTQPQTPCTQNGQHNNSCEKNDVALHSAALHAADPYQQVTADASKLLLPDTRHQHPALILRGVRKEFHKNVPLHVRGCSVLSDHKYKLHLHGMGYSNAPLHSS
jgi:hypothetical protein